LQNNSLKDKTAPIAPAVHQKHPVMSRISLKISVILLITFLACSPARQVSQEIAEAQSSFRQGDYGRALQLYEHYISGMQNQNVPDSIYKFAGLAAFETGNTEKTLQYLNHIRHSALVNDQVLYAFAVSNRNINNLSRELAALEQYVSGYPNSDRIKEMKLRLFEALSESRNSEQALELWPEIETEAAQSEVHLNHYLKLLEEAGRDDELYKTSYHLLSLNPDNTDALFVLAKYYFRKAENLYQKEMEAYEKNRTHRQYAQLLRSFEVLNADFRKSLTHFLKLYNLDPKPQYAQYIGNIYTRFNEPAKANEFNRKANQ
jgi:hypothetical protein